MKNVTWPQVALILGAVAMLLGTVVVLSLKEQDVDNVLQFGGILIGALGIGTVVAKQSEIKDQVNGRMSKLIEVVEAMMHRLAEAPALPPRQAEPPTPAAQSSDRDDARSV